MAWSCAALVAGVAWQHATGEDPVLEFLWLQGGWPERAAVQATTTAVWLLIAVAAALVLLPRHAAIRALAVVIAGQQGMRVVAEVAQAPPHAALLPFEHAAAVLGPLALAVIGTAPSLAAGLLRVGAAATFAAHGWLAWVGWPPFVDLLDMAGRRLGHPPTQVVATTLLAGIGVVDLFAALALLIGGRRVRTVTATYMMAWGLITAASRTVHSGADAVPATLVRVVNGGVPLALLLLERARFAPAREVQR